MTSRFVTFGGRSVQIDCDGPSAAHLADFLFGDLPASDAAEPHVTLSVEMGRPDGVRTLRSGDTRLYNGDSEIALARTLLDRTLYHLSDRIDSGPVFHAAAVTRAGRCLLLPGKSGAGKTTLTTWLVAQGFEYLTDELVTMPLGSSTIVPFRRPLNIRSSARPVLAAQGLDVDGLGTDRLTGRDFTMIRLAAAVVPATGSSLTAIVLPQYRADVAFTATPLSKAQAALGLIECLINARNLPGHGFTEVTRLVREVPAFRVQYHDLSRMSAWMSDLAAQTSAVATPIRESPMP